MAKDKQIEVERRANYVGRTRMRKAIRKDKRLQNKKYNHANATWYEDGQCKQHCEMGGTCDFPCNGDC